jgi:hypothetical protein
MPHECAVIVAAEAAGGARVSHGGWNQRRCATRAPIMPVMLVLASLFQLQLVEVWVWGGFVRTPPSQAQKPTYIQPLTSPRPSGDTLAAAARRAY